MRKLSKRIIPLFLMIGLIGFLGYQGHQYWLERHHLEITDNAYLRGDIIAIAPKVSGYITHMSARDNQFVRAGDELFRIDPADYKARVHQAKAALKASSAAQNSLREQLVLQEALIDEAKARVVAADAEVRRSSRDRDRADNLVKSGWSTTKRQDSAVASAIRAKAVAAQARSGLKAAFQQQNVLEARILEIDARIEQAEAQLTLAKLSLSDTIVRSPVNGIVGNKHAKAGDFARPGVPLLARVSSEQIWVVANFKETQLARLMAGQDAKIQIDSFSGKALNGQVDSVAPATGDRGDWGVTIHATDDGDGEEQGRGALPAQDKEGEHGKGQQGQQRDPAKRREVAHRHLHLWPADRVGQVPCSPEGQQDPLVELVQVPFQHLRRQPDKGPERPGDGKDDHQGDGFDPVAEGGDGLFQGHWVTVPICPLLGGARRAPGKMSSAPSDPAAGKGAQSASGKSFAHEQLSIQNHGSCPDPMDGGRKRA